MTEDFRDVWRAGRTNALLAAPAFAPSARFFAKGSIRMANAFRRRTLLASLGLASAGMILTAPWQCLAQDSLAGWPNRAIFIPSRDKNERAPVVSAVCVHPNGSLIAAAGDDHLIRIFEASSSKLLHQLEGHTDWVRALDFSADGEKLVSVGQDGRIQVWNAAEGREVRQLHRIGTSLQAVKFSHDDKTLYAAGFDNLLRVLTAEDGHLISTWKCSSSDIRAIAVSEDDSLIAAAGRDGVIRLWKQDGQLVLDLPSHHRRIRTLAFSKSGGTLLSVGDDKLLRVDDVVEPSKGFDLPPAEGKLLSLAVISDELVAAGASNNQIYVWNTDTKELVGTLKAHTGSVSALAASGDSLVSAGYDASIRIWSVGENVASKPQAEVESR
jgi:WD40 repeat protein